MGTITNLRIQNPKILTSKKVLLVSDLHINKYSSYNINRLSQKLNFDFDIVLILGDILHDSSSIDLPEIQEQLLQSLQQLTRNKPTFIILGNHDTLKRLGFLHYTKYYKDNLIDYLSQLPNVYLVDKTIHHYQELSITGLELSPEYYLNRELLSIFSQELNKMNRNIFPQDTYNIFLVHDPKSIIELFKKYNPLPNTDLCLSGHMHSGLIPSHIHRLLLTNYGFVSPNYKFFPNYTKGITKIDDTLFHITEPVNSLPELNYLNRMYGPNCTILELESGPKLTYKLT